MATYHGVLQNTTQGVTACNYNLRQQILLFDKLILWGGKSSLERHKISLDTAKILGQQYYEYLLDFIDTLTYLHDQGIVTDITLDFSELEDDPEINDFRRKFTFHDKKGEIPQKPTKDKAKIMSMLKNNLIADTFGTRAISAYANRSSSNIRAIPLITDLYQSHNRSVQTKNDMLLITLKKLPVIDSSIPIKTVLDYKNDENKSLEYLKLLNWINTMNKSGFSSHEFEDHINYLIADYESNLKLHKLKYNYSLIQTVVNVGAEFIENAIRFKFKSATDAIFDIKKRKVEMLTEEKKLPGSEVAYIVSSNNTFIKEN